MDGEAETKANATVSAERAGEVLLLVTGMAPGKPYSVRLNAVNSVGAGPAASAELVLDPAMLAQSHEFDPFYEDSVVIKYTWLIALLASVAFLLILTSVVMLYYRRRHADMQKSTYLSAPPLTSAEHRQFLSSASLKSHAHGVAPGEEGGPLWIDRRWTDIDEKDSNSSERKLLKGTTTTNSSAEDNGNNEYAYIDRQSLATGFQYEYGRPASPEPYASTDILRRQQQVSLNACLFSRHVFSQQIEGETVKGKKRNIFILRANGK